MDVMFTFNIDECLISGLITSTYTSYILCIYICTHIYIFMYISYAYILYVYHIYCNTHGEIFSESHQFKPKQDCNYPFQ